MVSAELGAVSGDAVGGERAGGVGVDVVDEDGAGVLRAGIVLLPGRVHGGDAG